MKHKFCYDIMPKSAKIVVFDTQLLVSIIFIFSIILRSQIRKIMYKANDTSKKFRYFTIKKQLLESSKNEKRNQLHLSIET